MSTIIKVEKEVVLKFEDREIKLPIKLKENINEFWHHAIKKNPNLYNGQDYVIESMKETKEKIEMLVVKSSYAHYLYDERVGIKEPCYKCCSPWGGILLVTKDEYIVIGEMSHTTSVPYCLQIAGGGIDRTDIRNGVIHIDWNIKRELKEEMNLDLEEIEYQLEYLEYPSLKRNAYGFLAIGRMNQTKEELEVHFNEYKEYLLRNKLELEFNRLVFLKKERAIEELDGMTNPKRPYLRDLISEVIK